MVRIAVADVHRLVEGDHRRIHAANRRVLAYFFEPGTRVGDWWPCPVAGEGHDACPKRFWSDAESRRQPPLSGFVQYWPEIARGEPEPPYEASEKLFACRFYERLARATACELVNPVKPRPPDEDEEEEEEDEEEEEEDDDDDPPPIRPPGPGPSDWEMHLTCGHAPESERTNRFNLGYGSGPDIFEVVAHGGADTIHVHSEPPHLPITWSTKSDSIEGEAPSGSTTFDVEAPKLAKVGLMSVYRAKPREYEVRGSHLGKEHECTIRAYPPDEWKLDFEKIRRPLRNTIGPALWVWNNVIDKLVPGIDELGVKAFDKGTTSGLMRIAWEEAPFDTGGAGDPDFRAFPHFVFELSGEPLIEVGGKLELSIPALFKLKKLKSIYEKAPKWLRDIVESVEAAGEVELTFGGTQRVVVDSPDGSLRIGPDGPGKMEFEGSQVNTYSGKIGHEEYDVSGEFAISLGASPTLGVIFDPEAEVFGLYIEGKVGPITLSLSAEWKGQEPFDPIEVELVEAKELKRRYFALSAATFREYFGD